MARATLQADAWARVHLACGLALAMLVSPLAAAGHAPHSPDVALTCTAECDDLDGRSGEFRTLHRAETEKASPAEADTFAFAMLYAASDFAAFPDPSDGPAVLDRRTVLVEDMLAYVPDIGRVLRNESGSDGVLRNMAPTDPRRDECLLPGQFDCDAAWMETLPDERPIRALPEDPAAWEVPRKDGFVNYDAFQDADSFARIASAEVYRMNAEAVAGQIAPGLQHDLLLSASAMYP